MVKPQQALEELRGTPMFVAPELWSGRSPPSEASDVFAYAVLLLVYNLYLLSFFSLL